MISLKSEGVNNGCTHQRDGTNCLFRDQTKYKMWIDDLDDDQQEEIQDYFMESITDKIEDALKEFEGRLRY
jgi:hypothetical protein